MGYGKERPCKKCTEPKLIVARGLCSSCFSRMKNLGRLEEFPTLKPAVKTIKFDLVKHLHRQKAFSLTAFGPGPRTEGVIDHIRKELKEVEAAPHDLEEWTDLILLSLDGAWRAGYTPEEVAESITAKLAKNETRTWPDWRTADPTKAIEHIRS